MNFARGFHVFPNFREAGKLVAQGGAGPDLPLPKQAFGCELSQISAIY
jgi:hypothetical protein